VQQFTALAQAGVQRADAATYWRAYALDKMNRPAEALAAVAELLKNFPQSRWLADGRALDLQMRQRAGQPASVTSDDDELKLLAIQGLQNTSPERAVPMLLKVLTDAGSLRLKERALFVLAQSGSPQARTTLAGIARGGGNPELQTKAVQYIGMSGQPADVSLLADLYGSATDLALKRQVLRAFMFTGDRQRVFTLATTEKVPELRTEAVRQLGVMGAKDELWQLYQKESVASIKRDILGALGISGAAPRLIEVVNTERDPELRVMAVRQLGIVGGKPAGDALVALYTRQTEPQLRRAAVDGLFVHGNVDALVSLARKETNPEMRRLLVQKISVMGSPAALDFLTELLNK
jgi:HEAT repeat protein